MNLSDLQRKDVISLDDGRKLGKIIDAEITYDGMIEYFIVQDHRIFRFWKSNGEFNVTFSQIKKIGTDVILVEL